MTFNLQNSESLTEEEKALLIQKLKSKLTKDNVLLLQCDESRSQHKNKEIAIDRFFKHHFGRIKSSKTKKRNQTKKIEHSETVEKKEKTAFKKALRNKTNFE